jgi:hypothetical protein
MGTLLVHLWRSATNDSQPLERMEISFIQTWQFPKKAIQRRIATRRLFAGRFEEASFPKNPSRKCVVSRGRKKARCPSKGIHPIMKTLPAFFKARYSFNLVEQI